MGGDPFSDDDFDDGDFSTVDEDEVWEDDEEFIDDSWDYEQTYALDVTPDSFRRQLAACRTFIPQDAAQAMVAAGLGLRVTPQDLLIFGPHGPIENTLRFPDECVRHKMLDVIGDLALTGCEIVGHVVGYRCGHALHAELAGRLKEQFEVEARPFNLFAERRCA